MLGGTYAEVLRRAAQAFDDHRLAWAVIGGAALPARGRVRATRDLDILVLAARPSVDGLISSLRDAGFAHHPRADVHRLERVVLYRFWFPVSPAASTGLDVQVSTDPFLDSVVKRATRLSLGGMHIPVACAEDLVLLKLLSFRPIDRADAIELVAADPRFDTERVRESAASLGLEERWEEVLEALRAEGEEREG